MADSGGAVDVSGTVVAAGGVEVVPESGAEVVPAGAEVVPSGAIVPAGGKKGTPGAAVAGAGAGAVVDRGAILLVKSGWSERVRSQSPAPPGPSPADALPRHPRGCARPRYPHPPELLNQCFVRLS